LEGNDHTAAATRQSAVDVVVIGHFARDRIVSRGREETASGGSVYYGAVAMRRLGLRVAVVTRLAHTDFPWLEELTAEGIRVYAQAAPQTSGIENVYYGEDMERRWTRPLGFAGPFKEQDVPAIEARVWLVGPIMAGEVDLAFVRSLSRRGQIALDAQGFVRVRQGEDLVFRDWPEKKEGLSCVQFLKVDRAEGEVLTGQSDPKQASSMLHQFGAQEVVLTHPGGVHVHAGSAYYEAPWTASHVTGRTGRGDTCFAAYLAKRLTASAKEACRFAALVASLKMEAPGPFRGLGASTDGNLIAETGDG
jgi:sugar/nucleoside kinase (ribokinase family)